MKSVFIESLNRSHDSLMRKIRNIEDTNWSRELKLRMLDIVADSYLSHVQHLHQIAKYCGG